MTLKECKTGDIVKIVRVRGRAAFRQRLVEMGFVRNRVVKVIRHAPLQDPIDYQILNSEISLRAEEADLIDVVNGGNVNDGEQRDWQALLLQNQHHQRLHHHHNFNEEKNHHHHHENNNEENVDVNKLKICMLGNPNSGKTSLYNAISGEFEHVGNYSGVTVDSATIKFDYKGYRIELIDLPGTYSLSYFSPEEKYVIKTLVEQKPDIIINVVDASNLERNLYLTTQLIDMDQNIVMALNMSDELEKSGDILNEKLLSELLRIPIVRTVAKSKQGVDNLMQKALDLFNDFTKVGCQHIHITYSEYVEKAIDRIQEVILKDQKFTSIISSRFVALKLLENDREVVQMLDCLENFDKVFAVAEEERVEMRKIFNEEPQQTLANDRYAFIAGALKETYSVNQKKKQGEESITNKIDAILTHKVFGFPIFLAFLWLMFFSTFKLGEYPVAWLETFINWLSASLHNVIPASWGMVKDLLLDGVLQGIGGVIVFLPNILILFFFISIMETTGYMTRVAFIMDKLMHKIGLHGKSFIPLIIGFGCNVPAIMATRSIENKKDRLVTMLIIPFMSCSARLPIFVMLLSAFFPKYAGSLLFLIYIFGIMVSVLSALFFHKVLLKHEESSFVMEMPPYRVPTANYIFRNLWFKTKQYLQKMGGVILLASILIWFLGYFPVSGASSAEQLEQSFLGSIGQFIEPVFRLLGFDWKMCIALLAGVGAKEVVLSTMTILKINFTPLIAVSFIIFSLLYVPCIAVIAAIRKESNSWFWAIFITIYTIFVAYLFSLIVFQLGQQFF